MISYNLRRWTWRGMVVASAIGLAGCTNPYSPGQRAIGGGAIGAGSGAILGSALGGNAGAGALIGGALGAGAGALTTPNRPGYNNGGYNNGYNRPPPPGYGNPPPPGYGNPPPPGYYNQPPPHY